MLAARLMALSLVQNKVYVFQMEFVVVIMDIQELLAQNVGRVNLIIKSKIMIIYYYKTKDAKMKEFGLA